MLFFLNIANPTLDFLANIASAVGEQTFVIAVILYIFYNYDKKKGFGLFTSVLFAVLGMGILKAIVRAPRPFQVLESIGGKRPSGHTTTGSAFYTALALTFKKRSVSIFCAVMMALVGLSRLYLGVHWPIDVFAGLLLGVTVSFVVSRYLNALYDDKQKRIRLSMWIGSLSLVAGAITAILLNLSLIDEVAFTDLMKVFALGGGGYLGFVLESKKVGFIVEEKRSKQILRYLLGLIGILVFMGAKAVIPQSLYALGAFLRYTMVGLWATGLYPLIGKNLHLFAGSR